MTEKITTILEIIKELTLVELVDFMKKLEVTFDIDTTVPVLPMVSGISSPVAGPTSEPPEEKSSFDVILAEVPADKKIGILKIIRSLTGLGLKESKDIVDNVPKTLKEGLSKQEAESIQKELETAGAKILLK